MKTVIALPLPEPSGQPPTELVRLALDAATQLTHLGSQLAYSYPEAADGLQAITRAGIRKLLTEAMSGWPR